MAKKITENELTRNAYTIGKSTAVGTSDLAEMYVDLASTLSRDGSKVLLAYRTSEATTGTHILKAGDRFSAGGQADVTLKSTVDGITCYAGPFETARFKTTANRLRITRVAGATDGAWNFQAIILP